MLNDSTNRPGTPFPTQTNAVTSSKRIAFDFTKSSPFTSLEWWFCVLDVSDALIVAPVASWGADLRPGTVAIHCVVPASIGHSIKLAHDDEKQGGNFTYQCN